MSDNNNGAGMTKADLILSKVDRLNQQVSTTDAKVTAIANKAEANSQAIEDLVDENEQLKQELKYMTLQVESVYTGLSKLISKLSSDINELKEGKVNLDADELASKVAAKIVIPRSSADVDSDEIADKVAEKLPGFNPAIDYDRLGATVVQNMYIPNAIVEDIDYDQLADKLAGRVDLNVSGATSDIDYDKLGERVVQHMYIPQAVSEEIDYDLLVQKLAAAIPAQEVISPDYIASKVAEQIVVPAAPVDEIKATADIDIEELSRKVADKIAIPAYDVPEVVVDEDRIAYAVAEKLAAAQPEREVVQEQAAPVSTAIDEQALAEALAERLNISLSDELVAAAVVRNLANVIDSDEIADCVAKKVGTITPEQFDVMVDDDGCESLARSIESKIDYDHVASVVADKLSPSFMALSTGEPDIDTEELAKAISEKISVNASINEDVIADKAAAVLSNYLPEIDTDEIADKVVAGVIPAIPAAPVIEYETISNSVADKIVENQEEKDFDIVIDDEGLAEISRSVAYEIKEEYAKRFDSVDAQIENINAILNNLDGNVQDVKGGVDNVSENVEVVKTQVENVNGNVEGVKSDVEVIRQDVENINGNVETVKEQVEGARGDIENVKADVENVNGGIENLNAQVEDVKKDVEEIKNQLEDVKGDVANTNAQCQEISEQVKVINEKIESGEITKNVEEDIQEIQKQLASGVVVAGASELATSEATYVDNYEGDTLVTVSDLVENNDGNIQEVEEPQEENEEEGEEDDVIDEIVDDIDENPAEGEIMPDGIPGISGGVDFLNMMKYNRSFIARIIQGSDDVKQYYGQVKNALLSYKKVNSNVAWGAERFNKGRETIAKFKIRGKTLCLYLALDPNDYQTSVYHHVDVSDNKSMHGTPMMVKIKSPRGVKKAIRLIDEMLAKRNGIKQNVQERDYAAMYPYETIDELIDDGLVKDVSKK
jgi:predicted  nucleic acid-binding Zn-ribbon protein